MTTTDTPSPALTGLGAHPYRIPLNGVPCAQCQRPAEQIELRAVTREASRA